MKLYKLKILNPSVDEIDSMLIAANDEREARILADRFASKCKTAWVDPTMPTKWLNEKYSFCEELDLSTASVLEMRQVCY